jgi:DNA-directed RNA polymerase subunit RPC12/RpoP
MIRFSCLACGVIVEVADDRAGATVTCGRCSQELRVPRPRPRDDSIGAVPDPVEDRRFTGVPGVHFTCPTCHEELRIEGLIGESKVRCGACLRVCDLLPLPVVGASVNESGEIVRRMKWVVWVATAPLGSDVQPPLPHVEVMAGDAAMVGG